MNDALCFALLFLVFAPGSGAESFPVTSRYDRASNTTMVRIELLSDDSSPVNLTLQGRALFPGMEPNEDAKFSLVIAATQGRVTRKSPPLLDVQQPLRLSLDETSLEVPLKEYNREFYEMVLRVSESATAEIPRADWPKLLTANQLSGQCGAIKFKLSEAALTALKDFLLRQALASPVR